MTDRTRAPHALCDGKTMVERYRLETSRILQPLRLEVISDYHGGSGPEEEDRILRFLAGRAPDLILIPGDLITRKKPEDLPGAEKFLRKLMQVADVVYVPGNHESAMFRNPEYAELFREFWDRITALGVITLRNRTRTLQVGENRLTLFGLELGEKHYRKPFPEKLCACGIDDYFSEEDAIPGGCCSFEILLAHTPRYGDAYLDWGTDLTVCGHYHGGVIRLGRRRGLISTYFHLFPAYCCGDFHRNGRTLIVSAGAGEHFPPMRVCNPRVVVEIDLLPLKGENYGDSGEITGL